MSSAGITLSNENEAKKSTMDPPISETEPDFFSVFLAEDTERACPPNFTSHLSHIGMTP